MKHKESSNVTSNKHLLTLRLISSDWIFLFHLSPSRKVFWSLSASAVEVGIPSSGSCSLRHAFRTNFANSGLEMKRMRKKNSQTRKVRGLQFRTIRNRKQYLTFFFIKLFLYHAASICKCTKWKAIEFGSCPNSQSGLESRYVLQMHRKILFRLSDATRLTSIRERASRVEWVSPSSISALITFPSFVDRGRWGEKRGKRNVTNGASGESFWQRNFTPNPSTTSFYLRPTSCEAERKKKRKSN